MTDSHEPLSDKEYDAITNALINWFKSQDINPKDAGVVMCKLSAILFVENSIEINSLNDAIRLHSQLLTTEIRIARKFKLDSNAKT